MTPWRPRGVRACLAVAALLAVALAPLATAQEVLDAPTSRGFERMIGSLSASACDVVTGVGRQAWCGTLERPWDPEDPTLGSFELAFAVVLPEQGTVSAPAVVGLEGGPGYGGIDSGQSYADMLGPLLADRALVMMDARGTGRSSPVRCTGLGTSGTAYERAVRECGASLGERSGLFGSALAADDLAALIDALGLGRVFVYGDSYGTFLAQVFGGRHPSLIRGLVLDGAYPVVGETAWYPTQGPALRRALEAVCRRTPSCAARPGGTVERLAAVLNVVRAAPALVDAPGGDGRVHRVKVTPGALVEVAYNGTYAPTTYREFDAALRAALGGDWLPIGRLVAEYDFPSRGRGDYLAYSAGGSLAVTCHDYPQLYDMTLLPEERRPQYAASVDRQVTERPRTYGPFTIPEYLGSGWAEQPDCLTWPVASRDPYQIPGPPGGTYPALPTLVLSGQLDSITSVAEGRMVAQQLPISRQVVMANSLHVTALGDSVGCASGLVRAFILDPDTVLGGAGGACARDIPPIRGMPGYPRRSVGLSTGVALAQTVADVLDRTYQSDDWRGLGLRGGTWSYSGGRVLRFRLHSVRLYDDLPVSGQVTWNWITGDLTARLRAEGQVWRGEWNTITSGARATMTRVRPGPALSQRFLAP